MSGMHVYVAAPYADAALVRMVHERLELQDITPTSRWAMEAHGAEDFSSLTPEALRKAALGNDADVKKADALLVIARAGAGGEMFAEARIALEWRKPVVWVGRRILSAWREGVVFAEDLDDAISILAGKRVLRCST